MGTNMPSNRHAALEYLEAITPTWNANHAAIGLTSAQVIDLTTDVVNTRGAFIDIENIRTLSKTETVNANLKADDMHAKASGMIAAIKAFAKNSNDPAAVYLASGVSPANAPTPVAPPAQPVITTAVLDASGSVTIKWDGSGPVGTSYVVSRKLVTESVFSIVGQGSGKEFTDVTIPAGTASAIYMVKGVRGTDTGPDSGVYTVLLGNLGEEAGAGEEAA